MSEKNITFEILEHLGVITRFESGWNRELNIISWNGAAAKYDLRDWDPHHERMRKGITLHAAEMRKVVDLYLNNNTQKAVEEGRMMEEQRRKRQEAQMAQHVQSSQCPQSSQSPEARGAVAGAVDDESYEGAQPPEQAAAEGMDLPEENLPETDSQGSDGESSNLLPDEDPQENTEFTADSDGEKVPF